MIDDRSTTKLGRQKKINQKSDWIKVWICQEKLIGHQQFAME
jgi:hypothetical protein